MTTEQNYSLYGLLFIDEKNFIEFRGSWTENEILSTKVYQGVQNFSLEEGRLSFDTSHRLTIRNCCFTERSGAEWRGVWTDSNGRSGIAKCKLIEIDISFYDPNASLIDESGLGTRWDTSKHREPDGHLFEE